MEKLKIRSGPFHRFGDRYGHMFGSDHFLGRDAFFDSWIAPPKASIKSGGDYYKMQIALPGFNKNEIRAFVEGDNLLIDAKRNSDMVRFVRKEFDSDVLNMAYKMPEGIKIEDISASYDYGILTIKLPCDEIPPELFRKEIEVG